MNRRRFLRASLGAAGGLLAAPFGTAPIAPVAARPMRGGTPKRVLVVGAGLAGLAAAFELVERGHDVTVLEARARPGGRVLTLRHPFADGLYAEAGPISIPSHHDLPRHYVARFGLPTYDTSFPEGDRVWHLENRRVFPTADGMPPAWPDAYALTPEENALGRRARHQHYHDEVLDALGDPSAPGWPQAGLEKYDQMTYADFLRSRGASEGYVARTRVGFRQSWGDGIDHYSALDALRSLALERAWRGGSVIEGGMDRLPKAFAKRLARHIRYGAPVVRIEQDAQGVRATVAQGGTRQTFEADRLVVAIPFSVLREVEVSPAFSPAKARAVRELQHSSVARVFVQFRERFWEAEGLSGMAFTDLPVGRILPRMMKYSGPRGILEAFITGANARHVTALPEAERVPYALKHLAQLFPAAPDHAEGGTTKCWDEDPWARGEYCWIRPGDMFGLYPHTYPAEGRLHFAGEQTSAWPGWMQGALHSGRRAADEIHAAAN